MNENTTKTYRVYYVANDGHKCKFTFKSDRSFNRYGNNAYDGKTFGRPFLNDMLAAAERYENDPNSKMSIHGGFGGVDSVKIVECIETGRKQYCAF